MTPDVIDQAWTALAWEWSLRWSLALGVGSFPSWAAWLLAALSSYRLHVSAAIRRGCAVFALLTCASSIPLLMDTYLLESQDPQALVLRPCQVLSQGRLQCGEELLEGQGDSSAPRESWHLRHTGKLIAVVERRAP